MTRPEKNVNRNERLQRRYRIVGILGSLVFHGAILWLPLYSTFTYVENAASPSLRIGLIELSIPEAMREISQLPAKQGKTKANANRPSSSQEGVSQISSKEEVSQISSQQEVSQIQDVFPMEELQALAQQPVPPLLSNCEKDESPLFFEKIADLPETRQSEVIQTSAIQARAPDPEPSELSFVVLQPEEAKEKEPVVKAAA